MSGRLKAKRAPAKSALRKSATARSVSRLQLACKHWSGEGGLTQ